MTIDGQSGSVQFTSKRPPASGVVMIAATLDLTEARAGELLGGVIEKARKLARTARDRAERADAAHHRHKRRHGAATGREMGAAR